MTSKYSLSQSPLFKLKSKKKLADLLGQSLGDLQSLAKSNDNYNVYTLSPKSKLDHPYFLRKERQVQEVRPHLKNVHERILNLLKRVQTPDYLHSATKGKSYRSNAEAHLSKDVIYTVDIKSFYESVTFGRIYHFFHSTLKCSPDISHLLTRLCAYKRNLPTGSCISPLLSFWTNVTMFQELDLFSKTNGLTMTLYVDDLTFSGTDLPKKTCFKIDKIIASYGYKPHKQQLYINKKAKIVTGLALCGARLDIPNKRRGKIRVLIEAIARERDAEKKEKLCNSLVGMTYEAAQFNRGYARLIAKQIRKKCPCTRQQINL
ncbi:reverse transcriptase family protein [Pseudodesulfovibrio indicus]|uniref:Reverse transcriptase (RNA-dependent DNA polymerase) n=1 Tax=Pseudodesulfovibrio indicus TaxID=1716143 RepID=A0AA94PPH6_9BACT|nr:reverse transcriptase family protein [Pseudodesulfovibrio indicus]TDT92233.1 reverse transcriptase (RNA-dependent DNA polymerase) [Pseudodesulfovibrio indicus]